MATIKALSWNVNGIRAAYKKGLLEWLAKAGPDILCIQETKASADQLPADLRNIEGYHSYFELGERKGYSGVALYTKREPLSVTTRLGVDAYDVEGRILIADYGDFVLFNIYFPNGKQSSERLQYKMGFYDAFLACVDAMRSEGKNVVICGDFNTAHKEIDIARPKENSTISGFLPEEREWMDKLLEHGFVDTFRAFNQEPEQYSWWDMMTRARDRNVGWRIDYFFANEGFMDRVTNGYILQDVTGSDHCPVGIDISMPD
jgi:exodeoxyribonuclease-3